MPDARGSEAATRVAGRSRGVTVFAVAYLVAAAAVAALVIEQTVRTGGRGGMAPVLVLMTGLATLFGALGWGMLRRKPWALAACPRWVGGRPAPAVAVARPRTGVVIVARFAQVLTVLSLLFMLAMPGQVAFEDVPAAEAYRLLALFVAVAVASFVVARGLLARRRWAWGASVALFAALASPYVWFLATKPDTAAPVFLALLVAPVVYLLLPVVRRDVAATWTGPGVRDAVRRLVRR